MIFVALCLIFNFQQIFALTWFGNFSEFSRWNIKYSYLAENRQIVNDPKGGFDKVLKVKYQAGSYSTGVDKGGTGFYVYPFENYPTGYVSFEYSVLFPTDFDFVKGGKLPGLFGGRHSCSGGDTALDCFSARFMWCQNGCGFAYLYLPKTAPHLPEFCKLTDDPTCSQQYGYSLQGSKYFNKDEWTTIKEVVKLNTPGTANGVLTVYVNGQLRFTFDKIIYRTTVNVPVSGFVFETFFGGNTPDWASPKEVYTYWKNFKYEIL